jgi:hypothetical protein
VGVDLLTRGGAVDTHQLWDAMSEATELPRPVPGVGVELIDLIDWARAHAADGDGRCSVLFELLDDGARAALGEAPPAVPSDAHPRAGYRMFREVAGLVRRLRAAEADASHGHWIFLRLETSATWYTVERCYDRWPAWMPRSPFAGPSVRGLRREVERRAADYRPSWADLL